MSGKDVNTGVKSAERRLSGHLGEATVVRDKVHHFLLQVLTEIFHVRRSLSQGRSNHHVLTDLGGVFVVFVRESPILRILVFLALGRYFDFCKCLLRNEHSSEGGSPSDLEEVATRS